MCEWVCEMVNKKDRTCIYWLISYDKWSFCSVYGESRIISGLSGQAVITSAHSGQSVMW